MHIYSSIHISCKLIAVPKVHVTSQVKKNNDLSELAQQDQQHHSSCRSNADCKLLLCEGHSNQVDDFPWYLDSQLEVSELDSLSREQQELSRNTKPPELRDQRDDKPELYCIRIPAKFQAFAYFSLTS